MVNNPTSGNSFAALAEGYGSSSDDDATTTLPRVKMEETKAVIPPLGLNATTRVEIDLTASDGSQAADDVTLTPPHGGGVRAREDTPSATLAFQERQAKINASNNDQRRGEVFGGASNMVASTKQVTSLPFQHVATRAGTLPPDLHAASTEILVPETQPTAAPGLSATSGPQNMLLAGQPRAAAAAPLGRAPAMGKKLGNAAPAAPPPRALMRTEPAAEFARRAGSTAGRRINHTAPTSPSPAPSVARSQAGSGAASPQPQDPEPAARAQTAGDADVDMFEDGSFPIAPAAQPQAHSSPSPAELASFEPRGSNLVGVHRQPTDKERVAMAAFAPELAYATVPFKAFGSMRPIDGALQDAHLFGVGEKQIAYFEGKPGPKVVCHVFAMFNRLATAFTIDEIIEMLENLSDRLFVAFPEDRVKWAHFYTPSNAPSGHRVRTNTFVGFNFNERQQFIWNAGRFLNAGDAQLVSYLWREAASIYRYSFAYFRTDDVDEALLAVRMAMYDSNAVKACVTRQAQEDGVDPVDLMEAICARVRLGKIMVARPKSSVVKPQYDVYLGVDDIFSAEELERFAVAFRALNIEHEEYGKAGIVRWACRICQAISHPAGKCAAVELAGWKEQPTAPAPAAPSAPNFNKPRRDGFNQPAQPFNGGHRGGPHAGFA